MRVERSPIPVVELRPVVRRLFDVLVLAPAKIANVNADRIRHGIRLHADGQRRQQGCEQEQARQQFLPVHHAVPFKAEFCSISSVSSALSS